MKKIKNNLTDTGFTLMELLLVIGIIGILATVMVTAINPGRQLARARDTRRETDVIAILSVIYQYSSEHSGDLPDTDGDPLTSNFPAEETCIGTDLGCFDLASAGEDGDTMVPEYLPSIPTDPQTGEASNTGYTIFVDEYNNLTASASGETRTVSASR